MICHLSSSYCLIPHPRRLGNVLLNCKVHDTVEAAWKADIESNVNKGAKIRNRYNQVIHKILKPLSNQCW